MKRRFRARRFLTWLTLVLTSFAALPAQHLPAPTPTRTRKHVRQSPQVSLSQVSLSNAAKPAKPAVVHWSNLQLSIAADNSSLNQILRDIAQATGLTISGSVLDERVFGTYGPAPALLVVSQLLDGTGSNLLLRQDAFGQLRELVFTPRLGGITPPDLHPAAVATTQVDSQDLPPELGPRRLENRPRDVNTLDYQPGRPTRAGVSPSYVNPGTATEQSPNGVKTPSQLDQEHNGAPVRP